MANSCEFSIHAFPLGLAGISLTLALKQSRVLDL